MNKNLKAMVYMLMVFCMVIGCKRYDDLSYEKTEAKQTRTLMNESYRQVGLPNIVNFQQKKIFKMIYEKADKANLITYAYVYNAFQGKFVYLGRSLGYGIPFSAQYTCPQKAVLRFVYGARHSVVLPQPDPNGLYMPTSSSATWIILIDERTGDLNLVYFEPLLTVTEIPLPSSIVVGYPKDFWQKYSEGKYNMTKQEVEQKLQQLKVR